MENEINVTPEAPEALPENAAEATEEIEAVAAESTPVSPEERLAEEFLMLKKECPEVESFASLPLSVRQAAAQGEELLRAFLRWEYRKTRAERAAEEEKEKAGKAAVGSLADGEKDEDTVWSSFMRGLRS